MATLSPALEQQALVQLERLDARLTSSRREILAVLEDSDHPLTVTDIVKRSRSLAQSSLYRNLTVLENADLIHRIVSEHDFAYFELSEHVLGHHHHLRCLDCGEVHDVDLTNAEEAVLDSISQRLAKNMGFTSIHHDVEFTGQCKKCS